MKALILSIVCLPMFAIAQPGDGEGRRQGRRGPPPEALAACQGASAGDACSFEGRRGEDVTGTCFARDERPLACRPERRRRRRADDE